MNADGSKQALLVSPAKRLVAGWMIRMGLSTYSHDVCHCSAPNFMREDGLKREVELEGASFQVRDGDSRQVFIFRDGLASWDASEQLG